MNDQTFYQSVAPQADRQIDISRLPRPDGDYMREFERILQEQFGIKITNLSGHRIGGSAALPGPWWPKTGFRETLRGRLAKYEVKTPHAFDLYAGTNEKVYMQGEYDCNLHIEPADQDKFPHDTIVCEVTPGENFRDTDWFPLKAGILQSDFSEPQLFLEGFPWDKPSALVNFDLCLYGPYVADAGDDDNPEIHPIDAIWWRRQLPADNQIRVILLQDAAKGRFREEGMFKKIPADDHFAEWKPWVQYPQLEEIRIPFTYDPQDKKYWHIRVEVNIAMDITTHLQTEWRDSDDGAQHQLLQATLAPTPILAETPILVRVTEEAGFDNRYLAVQFTDLTRDAQGVVRGYAQLVAALGDRLNKHEGVMVLTLTFQQEENTQDQPVLNRR